jgi:hypothetical protein
MPTTRRIKIAISAAARANEFLIVFHNAFNKLAAFAAAKGGLYG